MGGRILRYYAAPDIGGNVCEQCHKSISGLVPMTEHKLYWPHLFVCVLCRNEFRGVA